MNTFKVVSESLRKEYNFELIVSDGGSTDETANIAQIYADAVVIHKSLKDKHCQGKRGAEFAKGEILVFLNVDSVRQI